jgi:hypothetical protein
MSGKLDEAALMPKEAALADLHAAVAAYNTERPMVERDMIVRLALSMGGFLLVVAIVLYLCWLGGQPKAMAWVGGLSIVAGGFVWSHAVAPSKQFQQRLRDRMLPMIFGFVEGVRYTHGVTPSFMGGMPGNEFVRRQRSAHQDTISGTHEGLAFTMSETELSSGSGKSKETTFKGVIFHFLHEPGFPGVLLAARRPNAVQRFMRDLFGSSSLTRVTSGNVEVDESHEFQTNSPGAATPIVQGTLAKALDYLSRTWPDDVVRIALQHRDCYLLVPSKKDFFELPPVDTPIRFDLHIRPMIHDLVTLLATAQLVRRIG